MESATALPLKICSTMTKDNCQYFIDNCRCKIVIDMLRSESVAHRSEKINQIGRKNKQEYGARRHEGLIRCCHYYCAEEPLKRLVDWYSPAVRWLPYPTMEVIVMITHVRNFS